MRLGRCRLDLAAKILGPVAVFGFQFGHREPRSAFDCLLALECLAQLELLLPAIRRSALLVARASRVANGTQGCVAGKILVPPGPGDKREDCP